MPTRRSVYRTLLAIVMAFVAAPLLAEDAPPSGGPKHQQEASRTVDTVLAELRTAQQRKDAGALRKLTLKHYRRLAQLDTAQLNAELKALLARSTRLDVSGLTASYLVALANRPEGLAPTVRAQLDEMLSKLAIGASPVGCARAFQRLAEELARGSGQPIEQELWLENLACDSAQTVEAIRLEDPLVLDAVDAGDSFVYLLDPPQGTPAEFTATIDPQPPLPVRFATDGHQLVLQTLPLRKLQDDARTQVYTITITSGGTNRAYRAVIPVNLGMRLPVQFPPLLPGEPPFEVQLPASGGPADCGLLPATVQLPCGPMGWQWVGDGGAALPVGLQLATLPNGNGAVAGQASYGAASSRGKFRLSQGGHSVERPQTLGVPVHFAPGGREAALGPHDVVRGEVFSLRLPDGFGGDGRNYTWRVASDTSLPPGLQLVGRDGANWIEGVITDDTPLGAQRVTLEVTSPLAPAPTSLFTHLKVAHRLRLWTQNTFLRPEDAFESSFYAEVSAQLLNPFNAPTAGTLLTAAGVVEAIYDREVKNTDEDNSERLQLIRDRVASFEVVALQEVFDNDRFDDLLGFAPSQGYFALAGPEGRGWRLPNGLSEDAALAALPKSRSGLVLLVKDDLHVPATPVGGPVGGALQLALKLQRLNHQTAAFTSCHGVLSNASDCLANKGFTVTTVRVGPDPDEFLFVVNTHLDAAGDAGDMTARTAQLMQMGAFLATAADAAHPTLFLGDFNIIGETDGAATAEHARLLAGLAPSGDLYRNRWTTTAKVGFTVNSQHNAYAHNWGNDNDLNPTMERLDYMLVRQGSRFRLVVDSIEVMGDALDTRWPEPRTGKCYDPELLSDGWVESDQSLKCYLSDHYGLEAVMRLVRVSP